MRASNFQETAEAPKPRKSFSLDSSPITIYDFQFTIFNCNRQLQIGNGVSRYSLWRRRCPRRFASHNEAAGVELFHSNDAVYPLSHIRKVGLVTAS